MTEPATLGVRNPRTGQVDYWIVPPETDALDTLVERLRAGQPAWRDGGLHARLETLARWRDALAESRDAIVGAPTRDTGRHAVSALELDLVLGALDRWQHQAPRWLPTATTGKEDRCRTSRQACRCWPSTKASGKGSTSRSTPMERCSTATGRT